MGPFLTDGFVATMLEVVFSNRSRETGELDCKARVGWWRICHSLFDNRHWSSRERGRRRQSKQPKWLL